MDTSEHRQDPVDVAPAGGVGDAIDYVRMHDPVEHDPLVFEQAARTLADVAERAMWLHDNAPSGRPFEHGMRAAAKAILGRIPFPDEWRRP